MNIKSNSQVYEKYKIISHIDDGGFSSVYKAQYNKEAREIYNDSDSIFAIKYLVFKNKNDHETTIKRFAQEVDIYKKVHTKYIPAYIDSYLGPDENYLVMEYVQGDDLKKRIAIDGKMLPRDAVAIAAQIAEGIHELHTLNIIHRDIKSNNILIDKDNKIKIIDLGLALDDDSQRLTQTLKVVGSVYYMAPELCMQDNKPTVQSDIYALGILLFEMLAGDYPIKGDAPIDTLKKQRTETVPNIQNFANVNNAIANVIAKATAKQPENRYKSMWDFRNDLLSCFDDSRIYEDKVNKKTAKPKTKISDIINSKTFIIATIGVLVVILVLAIILIGVLI